MYKKILITGSNGMLGRNIVNSKKFKKIKIIKTFKNELNLKNYNDVKKYIKDKKPDLIIHCAARVGGIQDNINNPIDYLNDNFLINYNVINCAYKLKVKNFINIASSCIYPKNMNKKLQEEDVLKGKLEETNEGYALSKIYGLKLCSLISKKKNYNYITLIPSNLYGPYDKYDDDKSHLLAAIIKKCITAERNKSKYVYMWGNGTVKREFLYISDLVYFIYLCIKKKLSKIPNIINVGYGRDFTVKEYYKLVLNQINPKIKIKKKLNMPVGQKSKLLNISRAKKIGWKPLININEGISKTITFVKKNEI